MEIIERVTNMWWNPINHFKHKVEQQLLDEQRKVEEQKHLVEEEQQLLEKKRLRLEKQQLARQEKRRSQELEQEKTRVRTPTSCKKKRKVAEVDTIGNEGKWNFSCTCGIKCSSFDSPKFYPKGQQVECSRCKIWFHARCMFGKISVEELEKEEVKYVCCLFSTRDNGKSM